MKISAHIFVTLCSALLLALPASAQTTIFSYSGKAQIEGKERGLTIYLSRQPLVEGRERDRKIIGWRYTGTAIADDLTDSTDASSSSDELFHRIYDVFAITQGPSRSASDSGEFTLEVTLSDSLVATIKGQINPDGPWNVVWQSIGA